MTITALIGLIFLASIIVFVCGVAGYTLSFSKKGVTAGIIIGIIISAAITGGGILVLSKYGVRKKGNNRREK